MKLEHYPPEKLKREVSAAVAKHLDPARYKVFFFGSRVKGDSFPTSDIDIGIEGPAPIPADKFLAITEEIEAIPTLYKIEVVDFHDAPESFLTRAKRYIEYV